MKKGRGKRDDRWKGRKNGWKLTKNKLNKEEMT
jgi:hypothetical protein